MLVDFDTRDSIRLDAWRAVFQKVDRILSEQKVNVTIAEGGQGGPNDPPAWSDGLNIYMSGPKIKEMLSVNDKMAAVLRLKGLNYHELCHVLYTPRMTDELCRRLQKKISDTGKQEFWYAFNALEDQRIETWFTSTYGASRRYFEATILEWIIKNGSAESAVLIYGRKYLTPKIRVQAGRVFTKRYPQHLYDEFKTVIDEYLTLVLPTDSIKAFSLIHRYVELLDQMRSLHGAPLPALVISDNGGDTCPSHNDATAARHGRVYVGSAKKAAKKASEVVEDAIDADLEEEARRDEEGEGSSGGGSQSQQSQQSGSDPGDGAGQGGDENDDDGSPSDSAAASDGAGGKGASSTGSTKDHVAQKGDAENKSLGEEIADLADAAHDGMDEIQDDEWVKQDVENLLDAVKAAEHNGRLNAAGAAARGTTTAPDAAAMMATRRVHDILARIRQEAEPETLWRQNHGRVDPRRVVQRRPHETDIFKTWDHGSEEETGVEAVVLVDVSGSMSGILPEASSAMWALKRAFDRLDIRTTVLLFDTDHLVLYQPSEKALGHGIPVLQPGGGTDPTTAIQQAQRILHKSESPNKVLITVTDGSWGANDDHIARMMKHLHKQGVVSLLLGLQGSYSRFGKHSHHEGHDISTIAELPKAALKLVATIMRNASV